MNKKKIKKKVLKFEFCKNDKMRLYQLVSSPETNEKNHEIHLKRLEKN